jgi:hypothetical protein
MFRSCVFLIADFKKLWPRPADQRSVFKNPVISLATSAGELQSKDNLSQHFMFVVLFSHLALFRVKAL